MSLSTKQQRFTECVGTLIAYAYERGYAFTFGDAYRDSRLHGDFGDKRGYGAANSVHKLRLAVDLNLFVDGQYITDTGHPAYTELGELWESLDADARWGGRFEDGNHFSFEHWGFK
mgnify:CR=1 FL=1